MSVVFFVRFPLPPAVAVGRSLTALRPRALKNISVLEKMDFVMKGGAIYKNALTTDPVT